MPDGKKKRSCIFKQTCSFVQDQEVHFSEVSCFKPELFKGIVKKAELCTLPSQTDVLKDDPFSISVVPGISVVVGKMSHS